MTTLKAVKHPLKFQSSNTSPPPKSICSHNNLFVANSSPIPHVPKILDTQRSYFNNNRAVMETKLQRREKRRAPVQLILPLSDGTSEIKTPAWFQNTHVYFRLPSAEATQRQLFFKPVSFFLDRPTVRTPCYCRQEGESVFVLRVPLTIGFQK